MGTCDPGLRAIRLGGRKHAHRRAAAGEPVVLLRGTSGISEPLLELPAEGRGG
jgi:hypothetical protein